MNHRHGHPKNQTIFQKSPLGFALLKYSSAIVGDGAIFNDGNIVTHVRCL
jgi:hypothetical protein